MAVIWLVLLILVGTGFYWLRSRCRFWYGLVEVGAAILVTFLTFYPQTNYLLGNGPTFPGSLLRGTAGFFAGVYIFVRGMDNIAQDLPNALKPLWSRVFSNLVSPPSGV
jgi:hypothetical protein